MSLVAFLMSCGHTVKAEPNSQDIRQKFHYGMALMAPCRYLADSITDPMECSHHLIFPTRTSVVEKVVIWGADYQMMIYGQQAGNGVVPATRVRAVVDDLMKGDPKTYCALFAVDCEPVPHAISEWTTFLSPAKH